MNATSGGYGTAQRPLAGAILCCTSIAPEQRTQLAHVGAQMGATIKLDLTSDVTHLIVGNTDSAKYRYVAKSRNDVKVLSPAWLEALREVWMEGSDNLDLAALEVAYKLPTFCGLKICLTGFDNPEHRKYIQETVDKNGAEYHGDLTKAVTHLIAAMPMGKKYEHALNWRMKIVSIEWFEQSLERGMVLDEALFNPTLPVEERGKGAWDRRHVTSPSLGKRTRDIDQDQALNPFRRKLRRSASTKMGSQSEALWAGITAANLDLQHEIDDGWIETSVPKPDGFRESTPAVRAGDAATSADDMFTNMDHVKIREQVPQPPNGHDDHGIFSGRLVCPHGFDAKKTDILQSHLASQGARVLRTIDLDKCSSDVLKQGFLVVPHDAQINLALVPDRAGSLMTLVSNWWVERCLHSKRLVDPADNVLSRPFEKLSISGFSGLTINSTGFVGIDLLHVTKIVALMGATYDEQLSSKTSVMICNSTNPNVQKLKFASEKRIPAVTAKWLWDCVSRGSLQSYTSYQLNKVELQQPQKPRPKSLITSNESIAPRDKENTGSRLSNQPLAKKSTKPQMPRALEFAHSAAMTPESVVGPLTHADTSIHSFGFDHDEHAVAGLDGPASLPLQDISANSPRRPLSGSIGSKPTSRERSSSAESLIRAVPTSRTRRNSETTNSESVVPPLDYVSPADAAPRASLEQGDPGEKDYSDMLAKLRANRKAAPTPVDQIKGKRPRRQLGRATSTRSNQSTGDISSGHTGLDNEEEEEEEEEENTLLIEEYQPSQVLGWDSPGAAKAREQMIKKLGGTLKEKSVPVKGIGIVRDVGGESMGRSSRRRG